MVTTDDVAAVVNGRLGAEASFVAAVPGGAFFGRGPDTPDAYPYGVFRVEEAAPAKVYSGSAYTQAFRVNVGVFVPDGQAGSDPAAVEQALFAALGTAAAQTAAQASALRNAGERVLHCKPLAPDGKFDPALLGGRDVFLCGLTVEVLVQGNRGVS